MPELLETQLHSYAAARAGVAPHTAPILLNQPTVRPGVTNAKRVRCRAQGPGCWQGRNALICRHQCLYPLPIDTLILEGIMLVFLCTDVQSARGSRCGARRELADDPDFRCSSIPRHPTSSIYTRRCSVYAPNFWWNCLPGGEGSAYPLPCDHLCVTTSTVQQPCSPNQPPMERRRL